MIKYKLTCKDCNILFNSWFASSLEYEKLKAKKYINCHHCGSLSVEKTLMSPSVLKSKNTINSSDFIPVLYMLDIIKLLKVILSF